MENYATKNTDVFYLLGDFQNTKRLAYADVSLFSEIETELCILDLSDE